MTQRSLMVEDIMQSNIFAEKNPKAAIAINDDLTQCIEIDDYPECIDIGVSRIELEFNCLLMDIELTMQGINTRKLAFLRVGERDESKRNILKKKVQYLFDWLKEDDVKQSAYDKFRSTGTPKSKELIAKIESVHFNGKLN